MQVGWQGLGGVPRTRWDGRVQVELQFLNLYMRPENAGGLAGSGLGDRV